MPDHDDFATLFELLPIGAYRTGPQGVQYRANPALVRLNGFDTEAQMLAAVNDIAGRWYVQPGRRAEFRSMLEAQGTLRDFVSEVYRYRTRERIWVSENAHLVRDAAGAVRYYEGTVEDVTERKRTEESLKAASLQLQEKSDALQLTLDNAGRGIVRVDAEGIVVLYNRRFLELLDLPESLLAARPNVLDVIRYQTARGDFGQDNEFLEVDPARPTRTIPADRQEFRIEGTYLRRTRDGRILEIATQTLPDGGAVRTYSDVTGYFNVQRQLADKSRTLQITLDNMSQGITTIDASGRTTTSNRRHQELLGFSETLMASQPTMEHLVRLQFERGDFGEDFSFVDALARGYVAVGGSMSPTKGPETYLRKTREGRSLEVKTLPLPDGGVVRTFTDVTDYVQAQEALARKQAQLSALVNNIPDRVWLKDADGVYLLSNPAHRRQHGVRDEDVIGKTAAQLFGNEVAARQRETDLTAMASDQPLVYEDQLVNRHDGTLQQVELVKVAMRDEGGRAIGVLGIARDITARKRAEAALIAARDAAEAGNRAKAQFLANMSHEIRTPMNAVIGMSDLLLDTQLSSAQREFAETIRTSGNTLLALINDILDFSRIESGQLKLERTPVNLAECVESALDLTSGPAAAKGLELLYCIEDDVPRTVHGDVTRLRQIFVNLINNAVKFTQRGEVLVTVSCRAATNGGMLLHGSVRDTGIGIPPERQDRLFQMFSQVDASTTRQYGGSGLGLAICRRLLTLMGGRIWLESSVGEGSDFQFEIPLQPAPPGAGAHVHEHAAGLAGRRLLLVDDNASSRRILTLQTTRWGFQPRAASSGSQALAWVDAGEVFEAAVLDAQMPGMDGYALGGQLRQHFGRLPLLLLTAIGDPGKRLAGLDGAQALTKPVKAQALLDALTGLFALQTPASAPPAQVLVAAHEPRLAELLPLRVLLAEDNLVNQRVAALILSGLGYDVGIATDGLQALEQVALAAAQGGPFDVILMDVQMPAMDGLEATRRLRAHYPGAARPWIIAMTANAMEGDREACLAAGMDDYLSKPIRAAGVGEALRRAGAGLARLRAG